MVEVADNEVSVALTEKPMEENDGVTTAGDGDE